MPICDINIEASYNDNGDYCLIASTPKHDFAMPITIDNLDDVVAMLNNAIVDIQSEERMMMAKESDTDND